MTASDLHLATSDLHLATRNAAALWTALGEARGHDVIRRPGHLVVDGSARTGLRVLMLGPDPGPDELAALAGLVRRRLPGRLTVEDPFGTVDLTWAGLTPRPLPVMIRRPVPAPAPPATVTAVTTAEQLAAVEDVVVRGFPLGALQPRRPGEAFPVSLLDRPGVRFLLARAGDAPAGACLTVTGGGVGGIYWMTTLPEHRSRGVGRALLHGALAHLAGLPVTLTAARAGRPLYESLGFLPITDAAWWS
ncbi:Acetyltransferase (GNAT) domain-containing protein [Micromonospora citrea]|uniref:Acetyltransferase (GNAT) domain-containing protein n=1 Tax=Micromonospora citrea TaxID=47855 RepID=A0A1C6UA41_9ACTN|nr:GNAT family N-acetyltransferase [Micromonospora citrea]SCL50892.1 Acetyltransferase (GNAT) domain-containing protein [Micromonospora citrea]